MPPNDRPTAVPLMTTSSTSCSVPSSLNWMSFPVCVTCGGAGTGGALSMNMVLALPELGGAAGGGAIGVGGAAAGGAAIGGGAATALAAATG